MSKGGKKEGVGKRNEDMRDKMCRGRGEMRESGG